MEVLGQPCLSTPDGGVIPMLELVNKIAEYVISDRYYIVIDCCANKKSGEEADKRRIEKALDVPRYKKLTKKIVNIKAVPGGYKASAEDDKTLTRAMVSILKSSLGRSERGVPLKDLGKRLQDEQAKQGSKNDPDVISSLSDQVDDLFPL